MFTIYSGRNLRSKQYLTDILLHVYTLAGRDVCSLFHGTTTPLVKSLSYLADHALARSGWSLAFIYMTLPSSVFLVLSTVAGSRSGLVLQISDEDISCDGTASWYDGSP